MKKELSDIISEYAGEGYYPFHMPGHKRNPVYSFDRDPYSIDITEIDGFDDLHHPSGVIADIMAFASDIYKTKKTFLLVNGSTCGILSAICAAAGKNDTLYLARNSHLSAWNAASFAGADICYLYPKLTEDGLCNGITTDELPDEGLKDNCIVFITSPTYEGITSDIRGIARAVHRKNGLLIVDEAHGAHFLLDKRFPESAVNCGADIVIQSLHKTLPALTQTALLHICSDRAASLDIDGMLSVFETSSPSYVFLSSIDRCLRYIASEGSAAAENLFELLDEFYERTGDLSNIRVVGKDDTLGGTGVSRDISRLIVMGHGVYDVLLRDHLIQMEMDAGYYCLGISSIMDRREGFERLARALLQMDMDFLALPKKKTGFGQFPTRKPDRVYTLPEAFSMMRGSLDRPYARGDLNRQDTRNDSPDWVLPENAEGMICAGFVFFYPPGIPVAVPGEIFDNEMISYIMEMILEGCLPKGSGFKDGRVKVWRFSA